MHHQLSQSESIRRVLTLAHEVMAFGLDAATMRRAEHEDDLLNSRLFFEALYVRRPRLEALVSSTLGGRRSIWLQGKAGSGKTSAAYSILSTYCRTHNLPLVVIDFRIDGVRALSSNSKTSNDTPQTTEKSREDLRVQAEKYWLELFERKVLDAVDELEVSRHKLALELFEQNDVDSVRHNIKAHDTSRLYQHIIDRYRHTLEWSTESSSVRAADGARQWLEHILRNPDESATHRTVHKLLDELAAALTPAELLFCIGRKQKAKPIVFVDSLDTVVDTKLRAVLAEWLKLAGEQLSEHLQLLLCVRPENMPFYVQGIPAPQEDAEMATFQEGSHLVYQFPVHPEAIDYPASAIGAHRGFGSTNSFETPETIDLNTPRGRQLLFESDIVDRRISFLVRLADSKENGIAKILRLFSPEQITRQDVREFVNAYRELMGVGTIRRESCQLANGNRRALLAGPINFLETVVMEHGVEWSAIGSGLKFLKTDQSERSEARSFALRSMFLSWLADTMFVLKHDLPEVKPVRPSEVLRDARDVARTCFDPTGWIESAGWSGNRLIAPSDNKDFAAAVGHALTPFYTLLALYHLSIASQTKRRHVQVRELVDTCTTFKLDPDQVCQYLTRLIAGGRVFEHGLIESSVFMRVLQSLHRFSPTDSETVWLTDRGKNLLENTMFYFSFIARRIRNAHHHKLGTLEVAQSSISPHEVAGLVDLDDVDRVILWLRQFITCEIHMIDRWAQSVPPSSDEVSRYKRTFAALGILAGDPQHQYDFISVRLVRSSRAFLTSLMSSARDHAMVEQLRDRVRDLTEIERAASVRLGSPALWNNVPRNRAFATES